MSRFTRHNPDAARQLYRCHLRSMRHALAGAMLLLLLIAAALAYRQTRANYSGRDAWGSAFAPALRVFSVADTWHARAALAQLPPPPTNDSPSPAPAPSPVSNAADAFAAMAREDFAPQTAIASTPKLLPIPLPSTVLPELCLPEPAEPVPLTDLRPPEQEAPAAQPDTQGHAPGTPPKRSSSPRADATARATASSSSPASAAASSAATKAQAAAPRGRASAPLVAARYRSAPPPPYPTSLRAQRISGNVSVLISINSEGVPTSVTITRSSGHPEFDSTARRWILQHWRFHPATRAGAPQPSRVRTSVRFLLD